MFDHEDLLKQWKLAAPDQQPGSTGQHGPATERLPHPALQLPAMDLTNRLRELEESQDRNMRQQAQLYCAIRFPGRQQGIFLEQRMQCEQREYERLKYPQRQN